VYRQGLQAQGIPLGAPQKPEFRVNRGSPNIAWVTQAFFQQREADLSFARVHRPTDNAITERFYGSLKQEEIYLVGNYPDERSAREEIGPYIEDYNDRRPHQALLKFTPAYVHQINNKTVLFQERQALKRTAWERRRAYWLQATQALQEKETGGGSGMDQRAIVDYRPNMEGVFERERNQEVSSHPMGGEAPKVTHEILLFCLIKEKTRHDAAHGSVQYL
jgi:hypothetical protein